jgi:hypothetical protein
VRSCNVRQGAGLGKICETKPLWLGFRHAVRSGNRGWCVGMGRSGNGGWCVGVGRWYIQGGGGSGVVCS